LGTLTLSCPTTDRGFDAGVDTEEATFKGLANTISTAPCLHCGQEHSWRPTDARFLDALNDSKPHRGLPRDTDEDFGLRAVLHRQIAGHRSPSHRREATWRTLTTPLTTLLRLPFGSALVAAYTRLVRGLGLLRRALVPTEVALIEMIMGSYGAQALAAACRLGVIEHLADGPLLAAELARDVGADPGHLRRLLEFLAASGVVRRRRSGAYVLTRFGRGLLAGRQGSLKAFAEFNGTAVASVRAPNLKVSCTSRLPAVLRHQHNRFHVDIGCRAGELAVPSRSGRL
jgi:methyltransferase family protein